jgi:hypothetical protein
MTCYVKFDVVNGDKSRLRSSSLSGVLSETAFQWRARRVDWELTGAMSFSHLALQTYQAEAGGLIPRFVFLACETPVYLSVELRGMEFRYLFAYDIPYTQEPTKDLGGSI